MRNSTQCVCLDVAAAVLFCGAASARDALQQQTVLLYNDARVEPGVLMEAEQQASRIFREARIELLWQDCAAVDQRHPEILPCHERMREKPLLLKIVVSAGPFPNKKSLAYAAVDAGGGSLAMVYLDRIRNFVSQTDPSPGLGRMLGYVMAHEIGHLLLSLVGHSSTGIMTADWGKDVRNLAEGNLLFTFWEAATIRKEVIRRATRRPPSSR